MRAVRFFVGFLLALSVAGVAAPARAAEPQSLVAFAAAAGMDDVPGFVDIVESLRTAHQLPPRYVTKEAAATHGWHGGGLCTTWPGHVIGGDLFRDAGAPLPKTPGRVYREADLDSDCRSRGAKRLIFSNDGLIFLTVDHYNSFKPVP